MGKAMKKLFALAAGTTAAWALAIRPRTSGKPDMSEINCKERDTRSENPLSDSEKKEKPHGGASA